MEPETGTAGDPRVGKPLRGSFEKRTPQRHTPDAFVLTSPTDLNAVTLNCYPQSVPADVFTLPNGGTYFVSLDLADGVFADQGRPRVARIVDHQYPPRSVPIRQLALWCRDRPAADSNKRRTQCSRNSGQPGTWTTSSSWSRSPVEWRKTSVAQGSERVQEYGFRLRLTVRFFLDSIKYLGFLFGITGRHPDPANIRAIQRMPAPKNVSQRRSFLGLISYDTRPPPSLHDLTGPAHVLLQRRASLRWLLRSVKSPRQPSRC
ncbi:hypothetical protein SprV_0502029600 [Sparganum proliferum]